MVNRSNNKGQLGQCQVVPVLNSCGQLSPYKINRLNQAFTKTSTDLYWEPEYLIDWEGCDFLRNLMHRHRSCMVVGNDGSGKACAASLVEPEVVSLDPEEDGSADSEDDLVNVEDGSVVIPSAEDVGAVFLGVWSATGNPVTKQFIKFTRSPSGIYFYCRRCRRHCLLYHDLCSICSPRIEEEDIRMGLKGVSGYCPLIVDMINDHWESLSRVTFLIRVPEVNDTLTELLSSLVERSAVIILVNPEQQRQLRKLNRFRQLPSHRFPSPEPSFFSDLLKVRVSETYGDEGGNMPFSVNAAMIANLLAKSNPGRYVEILSNVINRMEYEGVSQTVDVDYVVKAVADNLDEEAMVMVSLLPFVGWTPVADIAGEVLHSFNYEIGDKRLGRLLKSWRFGQRDNNGSQYRIPPLRQLLLAGRSVMRPLINQIRLP